MLRRAKHPYDNNYDYDTSTTTITDIDILLSGGMVSTSWMEQCYFGYRETLLRENLDFSAKHMAWMEGA